MATTNVPIEIVLQDPNNPIVPTPDSDGGSDNTNNNSNIAVPNTALGEGHTTTDGSSNTGGFFDSSSAAVTIIPAVVLTLALGAVVALLVRRHYKNKKSDNTNQKQITKKEKLAMAATSTMAVLAATVLVGQLLMTTTNAATSEVDEGTTLSTPDKIQIIANRYDDVTIVASTKAVSYATTDTSFGYKIFMSMAGNTGNLYLDGDTSNEYYFAPTTRTGLDLNSWGYNYDGEADYSAMPLASDPTMAQQSLEAASDEEFTVYYTMKADKDMPFGVYSGEIAYDIQGFSGFPASLTTMQQMTPEICATVYTPSGTETIVPTATLKDTRDNKTYEVAKLADGNCWMIQNLDLDLSTSTELTPANTNISSNWTPANSTIAFTGTTVTGWQDNGNVPYSADPGELYIYSSGTTNNDDQYTSLADCQAEHPDCSAKNHVGNYYNWSAAVATNNTENMTTQYTNVETDICPAGWRLPIGPNAENRNYSDMANLILSYDDILEMVIHEGCGGGCNEYRYLDGGFDKIRENPLSLTRSGYVLYSNPGELNNIANGGSYWSNTVSEGGYAYSVGFTSSYLAPANYYSSRSGGSSVRCVAK